MNQGGRNEIILGEAPPNIGLFFDHNSVQKLRIKMKFYFGKN